MANNRKHWIEVFHRQDVRPGLQDITDWKPDEIAKLVTFFDEERIPWAFGCGERMPDEIEWIKSNDEPHEGSKHDLVMWAPYELEEM